MFERAAKAFSPELVQNALLPAARIGRDTARAYVRLGPGRKLAGVRRPHLRDLIFATRGKRGVFNVIFGVDLKKAPHAHLVELGTQPHRIIPKPPKKVFFLKPFRRWVKKVEHPGARKKPFLRPATRGASRHAMLRSIQRHLTRLIESRASGRQV